MREFTYLEAGGASIEGEGHKFRPWGFAGGEDGATASLTLCTADGGEHAMPSKMPYRAVGKGDKFIVVGPAGGGYGDPKKRDPERVLADVLDGFVSVAQARAVYGVAIDQAMQIDVETTAQLRACTNLPK